jgi:short-subunit dehydrogenase
MQSVKGKVIWITGASAGIGEALVYALAAKGAKLILSSRRKEELDRVKGNCPAETQPDVRVLALDLANSETLKLSTEAAIQLFGHVDILINNGGIRLQGLVKETPIDVDRKLMEVNYFGAVALTKNILPHFLKRQTGQIVTVTSVTGKFGTAYRSGYAATKHALHGFYDSLRAELWKDTKDKIAITMICPGFIQTNNTAPGSPLSKGESAQYDRMPADIFAKKMVQAIERRKNEVYIGGREVWGVYLKRFFPGIFSRMIRKAAVH